MVLGMVPYLFFAWVRTMVPAPLMIRNKLGSSGARLGLWD